MIQVREITKVYDGPSIGEAKIVKGVREISFQVNEGEVFGLLGPNGAGKTTMIRLLMGFIKPDHGIAKIKGLDCWHDAAELKKGVGYLPGELNFFLDMSGLEFLNLMAGMHGGYKIYKERRKTLLERLNLDLNQPIRKMSKGMKQKLGIINALMLDADVLILDEPTTGLDPLMQKEFIELLLEEKKAGKTIFIASHIFAEIERTCDRAGIIKNGELADVKNIQELSREQMRTFEITLESSEDTKRFEDRGLEIVKIRGAQIEVLVKGDLNRFFRLLAEIRVRDFSQKTAELEEAFIEFYEGEE